MEIREITPENVGAACRMALRPGQDRFVAPVSLSLAEAYAAREVAWPRLVCDEGEVVAFVMGGFKQGDPLLHSTIWRLNVAGDAQGRGYGRFAFERWPRKPLGEDALSWSPPSKISSREARAAAASAHSGSFWNTGPAELSPAPR